MRAIVNGVEKDIPSGKITYDDVSRLVHGEVRDGLTVSYSVRGGAGGGTLVRGSPGVQAQPGMVFNAFTTGNA